MTENCSVDVTLGVCQGSYIISSRSGHLLTLQLTVARYLPSLLGKGYSVIMAHVNIDGSLVQFPILR